MSHSCSAEFIFAQCRKFAIKNAARSALSSCFLAFSVFQNSEIKHVGEDLIIIISNSYHNELVVYLNTLIIMLFKLTLIYNF